MQIENALPISNDPPLNDINSNLPFADSTKVEQPKVNQTQVPPPNNSTVNNPVSRSLPNEPKQNDINSSNVISNQPSPQTINNHVVDDKDPKIVMKVVLYFLLGLIFSLLGLIVAVVITLKKDKKQKVLKLIPAFIGMVISGYMYSLLLTKPMENLIYSKFPELEVVKTQMDAKYPNYVIGIGEQVNYAGSGEKPERILTVSFNGNENMTVVENSEAGNDVCKIARANNLDFDYVTIENVSNKFFILSTSTGRSGTCEEWESGKMLKSPAIGF